MHTFSVVGLSASGASEPASTPPVTTPDVPGAPGHVKASLSLNGTVTVSWAAPTSDGGQPLTGYRVKPNPGASRISTGPALQALVRNLVVDATFPLENLREALTQENEGRRQGKVLLTLTARSGETISTGRVPGCSCPAVGSSETR